MNDPTHEPARYSARDVLPVALLLGLTGGLVEGPIHIALQRLNVLENVWYQILWIAPIFNAVLLGVLGLAVTAVLSLLPGRRWIRHLAIFVLVLAACLPWVVLALKQWIQSYAMLIVTLGIAMAVTRRFMRNEAAGLRFCRKRLVPAAALTMLVFAVVQGGFWWRERAGVASLPAIGDAAPDVLVIVVDALRADHLSSYGYSRATSPNIDRLAAEGVLFEQAFSTASYTLPSHVSILTGLYPNEHHVEWMTARVQTTAAYPTLAETLKNRGYRTGAFSGNTFWFTRAQGFGRGFLHFEDFFVSVADMALRTAYGRMVTVAAQKARIWEDIPERKRATDTNRQVLKWIDEDQQHPFLTVINYMDVHDPYLPPQPFRGRFSNQPNPGGLLNWEIHVPDTLSPAELQSEIDAYDGAVAYVDDQIGQLMASLQQRRRARDLVVIVTADHGEEFGEHGQFLHARSLYREVIHVPLIVWSPKRVGTKARISHPVTNAAIPSTIMAFLDGGDQTFPRPPLQRLWETSDTPAGAPLPLSELQQRPWAPERDPVHSGSLRSLVSPEWHFVEHSKKGDELYSWPNDPREAVNRASDPNLRAILEQFRRRLSVDPGGRDR